MKIRLQSLYLLALLFVYINLSFTAGSDILIFAMVIIATTIPFIGILYQDIILLCFLTCFTIGALLFSWNKIGSFEYLIGSLFQFNISIFLGVVAYRLLLKGSILYNKKIVNNILFVFLFLMFLELIGVTQGISNNYRMVFLGVTPDIISIEHIRDIEMTKWFIRPNIFSKEASLAYLFFFTFSICYIICSAQFKTVLIFALINIVLFFIYRTPSVILTLGIYFVIVYFNKKMFLPNLKEKSGIIINIIFVLVVAIIFFGMKNLFLERFSDIDFQDVNRLNSITIRVVAPIHFAIKVINEYPLFGIGLGNLELYEKNNTIVGNNALFYLIGFIGIIGTILFFAALTLWLIREGIDKLSHIFIIFCCFIALSLQTGAILNYRMWFYFFTIIAFYRYFYISSYKSNPDNVVK